MKRRDFLKLLTVAPLAPSVLAGKKVEEIADTSELDIRFYDGEDESELVYFYVTTDMGESNDTLTCTLYGVGRDGNYVKIDNYSFVDNGNGRYNVNIPEGVL